MLFNDVKIFIHARFEVDHIKQKQIRLLEIKAKGKIHYVWLDQK